jgi:uncharacterized membrane protein
MRDVWDTGRTEAFSDGVFAIAITLLVLEIGVPDTAFDDNLWKAILHQWPSYLAYVTSFLTVGGVWLAHHAIFGRLQSVDANVMRVNLLLLMMVSFLPFPTRLMAEAIHNESAERAAVVFYGSILLVISVLIGALWRFVARRRELVRADVSDGEVDALLRATTPNVGAYVFSTLLAVVLPYVAAVGYLLIAAMLVLRARGDREAHARHRR